MSIRIAATIPDAMADMLTNIVGNPIANVGSRSEAIKNAIILYKALLDERTKGNTIAITDSGGALIKEVVIAI